MVQALRKMSKRGVSSKAGALGRVSLLCAGLAAAGNAAAEANPYYFGGSVGLNHVSNVYRTEGSGASDTVTQYSLLAGLDQQIGREHLVVDGSLQSSRYAKNTGLNNNGYSLRASLDWATAERISGTFSTNMNRQLANYNSSTNVQPVFDRNIETDRQFQALVRVGLVTRYSLEASYTHYDQDFSLIEYSALVYRQNALSVGLVFKPSDLLRAGLALRHTTGDYPRYPLLQSIGTGVQPVFVYQKDEFTRKDIDFTTDWQLTGSTHLNTRLSWTDAVHNPVDTLNYRGLTGAIGVAFNPGGRWRINGQMTRDTGEQVSTLGPGQNRVGTGYQLNGSYDITSKIALTGSAATRHGAYENSVTHAPGHDNDHTVSLGLRYAYSRAVSASCQAYRSGRSSSTVGYNYDASGFGCTAQLLLY